MFCTQASEAVFSPNTASKRELIQVKTNEYQFQKPKKPLTPRHNSETPTKTPWNAFEAGYVTAAAIRARQSHASLFRTHPKSPTFLQFTLGARQEWPRSSGRSRGCKGARWRSRQGQTTAVRVWTWRATGDAGARTSECGRLVGSLWGRKPFCRTRWTPPLRSEAPSVERGGDDAFAVLSELWPFWG